MPDPTGDTPNYDAPTAATTPVGNTGATFSPGASSAPATVAPNTPVSASSVPWGKALFAFAVGFGVRFLTKGR